MNSLESMIRRLFKRAEEGESRIDSINIQVQQIEQRSQVHGMDIYIQDTVPKISVDHIWINTNINQFME